MKGIFCSVKERPLPQETVFSVEPATDEALRPVMGLIGQMTPWVGFGDDVFACRYVFNDSHGLDAMACLMQFYRFRVFLGVALPPEIPDNVIGHVSEGGLFVPGRSQ